MTLILLLIVTISCAVYAQKAKGRTGAAWGLITFLLGLLWWGFLSFAIRQNSHMFIEADETALSITMALMVNVPLWAIMALVVFTLPNHSKGS
jgi:hypothetical protein